MGEDDHINLSCGHSGEGHVYVEQSDLPLDRAIYKEWKEVAICILFQMFIRDGRHISLILW